MLSEDFELSLKQMRPVSIWTPATAMPPSPTAAAQRLTEPERTSPAAKIPGRLVSSGRGLTFALFPGRRVGHGGAGLDESFLIALDLGRQPLGARIGADHGKNRGRPNDPPFAVLGVFQLDFFEHFVPGHLANLGVGKNLDVLLRLDPARKIIDILLVMSFPRTTSSTLAAPSERNIAAWPAELPLPATITVAPRQSLTFQRGSCVVNANAFKIFAPLGLEPAIFARRSRSGLFLPRSVARATFDLQAGAIFVVGIISK